MPDSNAKAAQEFGKILATGRVKKQLSRSELSARSGVSFRSLSHYEFGRRLPSLPVFYQLVKTLRMRPMQVLERIFGGGK